MESATHLGLPWRLLRDKLAPIQPGFPPLDVHYNLTLELLNTDLIVSVFTSSFTNHANILCRSFGFSFALEILLEI